MTVLGASVVGARALSDERSENADRPLTEVGQHGAVVPCHWPIETANLLLTAVRRHCLSASERDAFLTCLFDLPIRVVEVAPRDLIRDPCLGRTPSIDGVRRRVSLARDTRKASARDDRRCPHPRSGRHGHRPPPALRHHPCPPPFRSLPIPLPPAPAPSARPEAPLAPAKPGRPRPPFACS